MIKKADIFLGIALIILCLTLSFALAQSDVSPKFVRVTVGSELYGTYDLSQNQDITIKKNGHTNVIQILNQQVKMIESDCKNQVCVEQGRIEQVNQSIVCLPNHVIVTIEGEKNTTTDSISY